MAHGNRAWTAQLSQRARQLWTDHAELHLHAPDDVQTIHG